MPGSLSPDGLRARIAAGTLDPLYLVTGDDGAGMASLASALAESVPEDFRAFNVERFHGTDDGVAMAAVLDAADTLPMLVPRRVVLLLQAERVLASRRGKQGEDADEDEGGPVAAGSGGQSVSPLSLLKEYAREPNEHATVALFGVGAGLARAFSSVGGQAVIVLCERPADELRALEAEFGVRFDRDAAQRLRQRAGEEAGRLRADVERVALYAGGGATVTRDQVDQVVSGEAAGGGRKLWSQLAERNAAAALREVALELAEGAVPFMILGLVRSVVERTTAARDLPAAFDALLRADQALKSSAGDPRALLERLIVEICRTGRG